MSFQLKSSLVIDVPHWIECSALRDIMACLSDGNDPLTLLVGGCVRNAMLQSEVTDIDLATKLKPNDVMARGHAAGMKVIPTGLDHGTVTFVHKGLSVEVTTLRKDVETDGRHAVVAFSGDWAQDAQRRDFTINTLLMDLEGYVYDPTGRGLEDLRARRVVFVGDAQTRIAEDALRILRFFRFHGAYGEGNPDSDAIKACAEAADKIKTLSRERITQEFFKIIQLKEAASVLKLMHKYNVLLSFFKNKNWHQKFSLIANLQVKYQEADVAARLYAIFEEEWLEHVNYLTFTKVLKAKIKVISQYCNAPLNTDHDLHVLIYRVGREAAAQILFLNAQSVNDIDHTYKLIQSWNVPKFSLTGDDLIAQGYERGPALGDELRRREQAWIDDGFKG